MLGSRPVSGRRGKPTSVVGEEQAKLKIRDKQQRVVMGAMRIGVKTQGEPVYIGSASNLTVFAKIGSRDLKLVLDTGAARSIIRTRVSKGLVESDLSKDAILRRVPIKNNVCCEGNEKGKKLPPIGERGLP